MRSLTEVCGFTEADLARSGRFLERGRRWLAEHPEGFYSFAFDEQFEATQLALPGVMT